MSTKAHGDRIDDAIDGLGDAIAQGLVAEVEGQEINVANALAGIAKNLVSPNEMDRNMEAANVVDGLFAIARAIHHLAKAVDELDRKAGAADAH